MKEEESKANGDISWDKLCGKRHREIELIEAEGEEMRCMEEEYRWVGVPRVLGLKKFISDVEFGMIEEIWKRGEWERRFKCSKSSLI